jgi:hypothetical protein
LVGSFHHGTFAAFPAYPDIDLNSLLRWAYVCPFRAQPISEFKPSATSPQGNRANEYVTNG